MISITDQEFKALATFIHANYGIHLNKEKRSLVMSRLQSVLEKEKIPNYTDYLQHLVSDRSGHASATFIEKMTTNHTYFMRETEHFDFLLQQVLPYLTQAVRDKDLRIWSAGCSTGEEPYTLAMILDDYFGPDKAQWDTQILATDISRQCLTTAETAVFPEEKVLSLPVKWKTHYFQSKKGQKGQTAYSLIDRIKKAVLFRPFNLMESQFPFKKKFHVIFCRNVMIYFDNPTRDRLVQKFYDSLETGGYLFIGHSETLNREKTPFKYIMPAVYRKQ